MSDLSALNLARRPFVNRRPGLRLAVILWALAVALTAVTATLYLGRLGAGLSQEQQAEVRRQLEIEREAIRELEARLAPYDVGRMSEVATFLNRRIAERTFAWSALFDHLAEVLPGDVRLTSLAPRFVELLEGRARVSQTVLDESDVQLQIRGVARSDEALLEFVDRLFEHERFRAPDLTSERRREGSVEFSLNAVYQPVAGADAAADAAGEAGPPAPDDAPAEDDDRAEPADPGEAAAAVEAAG